MPDHRIELETKSDRELLLLTVQTLNEVTERLDIQNGRLRSLELWRAGIVAVIGFLGFAVSILVVYVAIIV